MNISPTAEIIDDIRLGKMVVLVDAEDRENEEDWWPDMKGKPGVWFATHEQIAQHVKGLVE